MEMVQFWEFLRAKRLRYTCIHLSHWIMTTTITKWLKLPLDIKSYNLCKWGFPSFRSLSKHLSLSISNPNSCYRELTWIFLLAFEQWQKIQEFQMCFDKCRTRSTWQTAKRKNLVRYKELNLTRLFTISLSWLLAIITVQCCQVAVFITLVYCPTTLPT